MTRKKRRLWIVLACGVGLGSASALALSAFGDNLVFFVSPSTLEQHADRVGSTLRLGGMIEAGSIHRSNVGGTPVAQFRVTDGKAAVDVSYTGILPDLFREGQGAVMLGKLLPDGSFRASEVLAKHDETYMPRDVADALKKSGMWRAGGGGRHHRRRPGTRWSRLPHRPQERRVFDVGSVEGDGRRRGCWRGIDRGGQSNRNGFPAIFVMDID